MSLERSPSLMSELLCRIFKLVLEQFAHYRCPVPSCRLQWTFKRRMASSDKARFDRCLECDQDFDVASNGFPPNKISFKFVWATKRKEKRENALKNANQELAQQMERPTPIFDMKREITLTWNEPVLTISQKWGAPNRLTKRRA